MLQKLKNGLREKKWNMVPYILWTNYDTPIEELGTVTANYLAPWLEQYKLLTYNYIFDTNNRVESFFE